MAYWLGWKLAMRTKWKASTRGTRRKAGSEGRGTGRAPYLMCAPSVELPSNHCSSAAAQFLHNLMLHTRRVTGSEPVHTWMAGSQYCGLRYKYCQGRVPLPQQPLTNGVRALQPL